MQLPVIDITIIAPALTVFGWATALLLVDLFAIPAGGKRMTGLLAVAGLAVAMVVSFLAVQMGTPPAEPSVLPFSGMVVLDSFALMLTMIFLLAGILCILFSLDYLPRHGIEQGEFYPLIMFAVGGMIVMAQSTDLVMLFLGVELLSITLYILTAFAYPRLSSEEAGMKYLLLGAFAAGFFVYGIALLFGATGTINLFALGDYTSNRTPENLPMLLIGMALVLVALSFKVALAPFHMWTPDVYEGAPTPVTAFMSVGTKGAAFAAMVRLLLLAFPSLDAYWVPVLGALAVLTMLVGNIGALMQTNVKRMLAYSSIGHAGYIVPGVLAASAHGTSAFLFYLVAYMFTNLGAFGVIIALEQRGESAWNLDDFNGLWKRQPLLALAMAVFLFSLAGVPPAAGFFAKFYIFAAAYESGLWVLVLAGLLTSAIAVFFYLRVIVRMFMQEPVQDTPLSLPRPVVVGIALAAVATLIFGLVPAPVVQVVQEVPITALVGIIAQ